MHAIALCLALIAVDQPEDFVQPPAGVVIPPATPGDKPLELSIQIPPDAATKSDIAAINSRLDRLEFLLSLRNAGPKLTDSHPLIDKAAPCPSACQCSRPGECGETGCECKTVAKVAKPKQWYTLTDGSGYQGYGALNDKGEVVVEKRRVKPLPPAVQAPAPVTYTYSAPAPEPTSTYYQSPQQYYQPVQSSGCAGGSCYRR